MRADRGTAGEQAPAGIARRPAERIGERRGETHSLLWVQRFRRLVKTEALAKLLRRTIDDDRYPLSPRIQTLKAVLAKIRPEPLREPLPPVKVYAPPRANRNQEASR